MYVLYQLASIWRLPVFSTIEKKFKKGEPSDLTFSGGQKVEPFFLTFFPFRRSVAANSDITVLSILAAM
jgi:hypothetical protein